MPSTGTVHLVGAGPGDPDLLTLKALRLIAHADVIVHDRLVSDAVLSLANPRAVLIDVGKRPKRHTLPQEAINRLLIEQARAGRMVVRLKGGDPFVFGRGGEEAMDLAAAGIACEVVPGITAAQGAAASLGVPLTHRGVAEHVTYLTGHCRADTPLDFDFAKLADPNGTLVVYMGLATIGEMAARLIDNGLDAETPVLVVERATTSGERHHLSALGRVAAETQALGFEGPTLFVIGRVAGLSLVQGRLGDAAAAFAVAAQ
ncbi:uroporphyrinogen-III C-methyltransferase [Prosthecomicrobium hirschii]|uniref:uroporphyrinogen-III C-methyltransferase n=1 Tax=Prosthecodimorpha hirschii TaxID=665126 RepID=A0A0P6VRK2_9HYPH|nr:uroporphyrinogen-III C-methyltransferase [Prosthecomicrobium hirschii]KPL53807.1 uroporphyrin-III methyltransferase [Prosthecomicrobium hirschii]MCW1841298.1 uroporphyrinogen-III C-methyltransferase [Prosthecomicrobium hirschii]TPQ50662.1 uroporphyrinogen-III C-methyltransferase [Prosthecomicrobium hirschii]